MYADPSVTMRVSDTLEAELQVVVGSYVDV